MHRFKLLEFDGEGRLVVGDADVENNTVGVNRRGSDDPERDVPLDDFVGQLAVEVAEHR